VEIDFPAEIAAQAALADVDAEAALTVGRWLDTVHHDHDSANAWFKHAVRLGSPDVVWTIAEHYWTDGWEHSPGRLKLWMERAIDLTYPRRDAPRIFVRNAVFAPILVDGQAGYGMNSSLLVASQQPEHAAGALESATLRFVRVLEDGREFDSDFELASAQEQAGRDLYTISGTGSVQVSEDGPFVIMDFDSNQYPRMARTMIDILIEELVRAAIEHASIRPAPSP
jgi:hypothetical protein